MIAKAVYVIMYSAGAPIENDHPGAPRNEKALNIAPPIKNHITSRPSPRPAVVNSLTEALLCPLPARSPTAIASTR